MKTLKQVKPYRLFLAVCPLLFLCSCFGMAMDIELHRNGSGILSLEYRVSKSLDSLGRLDGNERWNTIPVGRADFERTLSRLPEMKLLSFSSKDDRNDIIITAKIEFSSINGLLAFLDAGGRRSSFAGNAESGTLFLALNEGGGAGNPELLKLIEEISSSYSIKMGMKFSGEGTLSVLDNSGTPLEAQKRGRTVSCTFPLYQVLSSSDGMNLEFKW